MTMPLAQQHRPDIATIAAVKRFRELWIGDDGFRAAARVDARAASQAAGLALDIGPLAFLWDRAARPRPATPTGAAFAALTERAAAFHDFATGVDAEDPRLAAWRQRQRARLAFALGAVVAPINPLLPYAVELSTGCSVGCWFCGLSAPKLSGHAPADATSLDDWRDILDALALPFGPLASRGMLFWATDPLDHPDYERFAAAFSDRFGHWPMATTALPLRDPARTRRLISAMRGQPGAGLRFSVLTRRMLRAVHETFSATELADVDLVLANRESLHGLAEAGRLRETSSRLPERAALERSKLEAARLGPAPTEGGYVVRHATIACVSGFLIDLPGRRVTLATPMPASERWPDGYAALARERFADAADLARILEALMARHMAPVPRTGEDVQLLPGLSIAATASSLTIAGAGHRIAIVPQGGVERLRALTAHFAKASRLDAGLAADPDVAHLWQAGVLVETALATEPGAPS